MHRAEIQKDVLVTDLSEKFQTTLKEVFPEVAEEDLASLKAGEGIWDSLGHLRLMMALESSFGLSIPPENFDKLQSVDQIEAYIRSQ